MAAPAPAQSSPPAGAVAWTADDYQARTGRLLLAPHHALIQASAISLDVAAERGYWSATRRAELRDLGFGARQQRVVRDPARSQDPAAALVIPVLGVTGEVAGHMIRPDQPYRGRDGRPVKYIVPSGSRLILDVHPRGRDALRDAETPLLTTEGVRKGDALVSAGLAAVALTGGVWGWRDRQGALPCWEAVALRGRTVYIVFDSDTSAKSGVYDALRRLAALLAARGAEVRIVHLPPAADGGKQGADDYLAAGHTAADLLALASADLPGRPDRAESGTRVWEVGCYRISPDGTYRIGEDRQARETVERLSDFAARIASKVTVDDGVEPRQTYTIEVQRGDRIVTHEMGVTEYEGLRWTRQVAGLDLFVAPGPGARDHLRAAIDLVSTHAAREAGLDLIPRAHVYSHTGWRQVAGAWLYLHAGGAIGADGAVEGVEVDLRGALSGYALPPAPDGAELAAAVCASLSLLDVAPDRVTVPLLGMVYRAPLGHIDLSGWLTGPTGAGKSELAALAQQHYGAGMDRLHLPGSWASTANALEGLASQAADVLLVIDDFAPGGANLDVQRLHREADRVLRAAGNASARQRMRPDSTLRPARPPRGLILGTGEDVPRGQSLRARLLAVEVGPQDIDWPVLGRLQHQAARGVLAQAMSGYVRWLARTRDGDAERVRARTRELRAAAVGAATHRRTPEAVAALGVGWERLLEYAVGVGAIGEAERRDLWDRAWRALGEVGEAQADHLRSADPVARYLDLLRGALASGRAHLAAPHGQEPKTPAAWGWRVQEVWAEGGELARYWRSQGERIGWVDGDSAYLEPEAAYAACQRLAQAGGETLAVGERTLERRLHERGLLLAQDAGRLRVRVRGLEGERRAVLHLATRAIYPDGPRPPRPEGPEGTSEAESAPGEGGVGAVRPAVGAVEKPYRAHQMPPDNPNLSSARGGWAQWAQWAR